jgi:hypothetical protein
MSDGRLIEELVSTSHYPLTDQQAADVLTALRARAAAERIPVAELVLCTDDVNEAAKGVLHPEGRR